MLIVSSSVLMMSETAAHEYYRFTELTSSCTAKSALFLMIIIDCILIISFSLIILQHRMCFGKILFSSLLPMHSVDLHEIRMTFHRRTAEFQDPAGQAQTCRPHSNWRSMANPTEFLFLLSGLVTLFHQRKTPFVDLIWHSFIVVSQFVFARKSWTSFVNSFD